MCKLASRLRRGLALVNFLFDQSFAFGRSSLSKSRELPCCVALLAFGALILVGLLPFARFHWHMLISVSSEAV